MICCPLCFLPLEKINKSLQCANKHNFDFNKYGYINLSLMGGKHGDNLSLIQARHAFLNKNYYLFLREEIIGIAKQTKANICLDLACGEGYYSAKLPALHYGVDLSNYGLRLACKNDVLGHYILASIFKLPFEKEVFDFVLTCFAPLAKEEITRVLKKHGYFLFVSPGAYHLYELKKILYPNVYLNSDKDISLNGFILLRKYQLQKQVLLANDDLLNLINMTPYVYKTKREELEKLKKIRELKITFAFNIQLWQKIN